MVLTAREAQICQPAKMFLKATNLPKILDAFLQIESTNLRGSHADFM